ncbi:MAG: hypothetical protein JST90_12320 [Bacteroidetes bacterium]|nr:hypothetical protein [Bacteroidota bacterium]
MKTTLKYILLALLALSIGTTYAQTMSCCRAAYFDIDTAPDPPLFTGIGDSHWPIVTTSDSCQLYFDQGIRQGHCFNDFEARRAFRLALRLDPTCAMCHWGLVSSNGNMDFDRKWTKNELDTATLLNERNHDSLYDYQRIIIEATRHSLLDKPQRRADKQHEKILRAMPERYQNNLEYLLLLGNSIISEYDMNGKPLGRGEDAVAMRRRTLQLYPRSLAAHHYWIHEVEKGIYMDSASASAALLPSLAPASPHILHMPGHIYHRQGLYLRADSAFKRAFLADSIYMQRYHISSYNDWNYIHNLYFLIGNLSEMGCLSEALLWQQKLDSIPPLDYCANSGINHTGYHVYFPRIDSYMKAHDWSNAAETAEDIKGKIAAPAVDRDHPVVALTLTFLEGYANFNASLDSGDLDNALRQATELTYNAKHYYFKKCNYWDQYYGTFEFPVSTYLRQCKAFMAEQNGDQKKAEKILKSAVENQKYDFQAEPPGLFCSPYEWYIKYLIRQHRAADASAQADEYMKLKRGSPYAAYCKALAAEAAGSTDARAQYRVCLQKFATDEDFPLINFVRAKAK